MKNASVDATRVCAPRKIAMPLQGSRPSRPVGCFCAREAIPYMVRLTTAPQPAFADWKANDLEACSLVVYQFAMSRVKPGEMLHSNMPCRNRSARNCGHVLRNPCVLVSVALGASLSFRNLPGRRR